MQSNHFLASPIAIMLASEIVRFQELSSWMATS